MKLLKKYNEFINENLIDYLKKNFNGLLNSFSDNNKKLADNISKEIDNSDNYIKTIPFIEKIFDEKIKLFEEIKNYRNVENFIKENLMLVELILSELSKKFEPTGQNEKEVNKKLMPNDFFEDFNNNIIKQIFEYNNSNDFQSALNNNISSLMIELAKKSGLKNPEEKFKKQNESQEVEGDNLESDESFKNFKKISNDFIINDLFKPILSKLKNIKFGDSYSNNLKDIVNNMNASQNKDSLLKILQKIISSDKETLTDVRNVIGFTKNDAPL